MECKFCRSRDKSKKGVVRGKQRYLCKNCNKTYIEGDKRLKYSEEIQFRAVEMSLNNCGQRVIGRLLSVPYQYVGRWIKKYKEIIEIKAKKKPKRKVEIMELDELWTYVKKKGSTQGYGLLWIESSAKLLILK